MLFEEIKLPDVTYSNEANEYVGLYLDQGKLKLSIPCMLRLSDDNMARKEEIILFLNSINLAKTFEYETTPNSEKSGNIWPFDSYLWIIRDYLNYGVYSNRNKVYVNNGCGRIEWKKTLKNNPIVSDGNVIYNRLVASRISPVEDYITEIYKYCVTLSSSRIGWFFNYDILLNTNINITTQEMIYIIKKEMANTYEDTKTMRYKHMLSILTNSSNENNSESNYIFGINNYYYVVEKMIDSYFNGISTSERKLFDPKGYWNLNKSGQSFKSSSLRPDTIIKHEDVIYILDSKMYKFGFTGNPSDLPETSSIQKQITYGDLVEQKLPDKKVRNAFIIPYDKESSVFYDRKFGYELSTIDDDRNIQYLGYAFGDWKSDNQIKPHNFIFTFLIDLNYLIKHYRRSEKDIIISLIDDIEDKCKSVTKLNLNDNYINAAKD